MLHAMRFILQAIIFLFFYTGISNGQPVTKKWYNGKIKFEGMVINDLRQGTHIFWYANGQKEIEVNYKNDTLDGKIIGWFKNQQIMFLGIMITAPRRWWSTGRPDETEDIFHRYKDKEEPAKIYE